MVGFQMLKCSKPDRGPTLATQRILESATLTTHLSPRLQIWRKNGHILASTKD